MIKLTIGGMAYHRLDVASQEDLFNLLLRESLEVLPDSLEESQTCMVLAHVNVWHAVAQTCVTLEGDVFSRWGGNYPVTIGIILGLEPVLFKLWDGKKVCNPSVIEPHLKDTK